MFVFLNGQYIPEAQAVVSVNDRGFLYGDGLFETMRVFNGRPFRLAQHLERLVRGADYLKIKLPFTATELDRFVKQLVEKNNLPDAILRVTLTRGPGERGYTPKGVSTPTLLMTLHAATPLDPHTLPKCRLATSTHRIPAGDALASFKTGNKLLQIVARIEAEANGADEALILNTSGEVAEAAGANVFWVYHGTICTVPTGRGMLPGITRAVILEICEMLGLPTSKRVIKPDALQNSEGIFLSQSALGVVCITSFDGEPVPQSPLAAKIYQTYCELLAEE